MTLKIGLVGIGHVAEAQIQAITDTDGVELVAAHDIVKEKSQHLPTGTRFFDSLENLLAYERIDIILVSVPNLAHYEVAKTVLDHDRACIVEKPASESRQEFEDLFKLAQARRIFLDIALHAAHALDVTWWRTNASEFDLGPITGFECSFFDPYIVDGVVKSQALGLGGSWFDSGINALSVVGRFIPTSRINVEESRMTHLPQLPCSQVQGCAIFSFETDDGNLGHGFIDTNWSLGFNRKVTRLQYGRTNHEVTLHHSEEKICVRKGNSITFEKTLANGAPRLANHYFGVFTTLRKNFESGKPHTDFAMEVHHLFFAAAEGRGIRSAS